MKFSVFQLSRRGGRANNEDRMGYCYTRETALFVLADGMGGHAEGEIAAQLALQTMAAEFQRLAKPALQDPSTFLRDALLVAHERILAYARHRRMADAPRTTLVAALVQQGQAYWIHCGDSRLYWVRDRQLQARTRDHSYAEMERVSPMKLAQRFLNRNVLYTCLGAEIAPVFAISGPHALQHGDRLLLCSDGLWDVLKESVIIDHLGSHSVQDAVPSLVEAALSAGGSKSDNVTALAMQWEVVDQPEHSVQPATSLLDSESFASTIQSTQALDGFDDVLDEAEIERSIAEINAAIRRSALLKKT